MAQPQFLLQPLAAAICVACMSTTYANDQSSPAVQNLAPVVITAQHGNDANGLIVRANPKQPIQPVPASDGADYLQSIVGFSSVNSGAGTNGDVTFRGMFGSRIKILTDGTENLGACPSRMDSPTSYISPESYDRISVIKGPQTVQYANTGSAATVIFERQPEQLNQEKQFRGQASVLIGSFGRLDHNIEVAAGDEQKYIRLNANRSVSDSYKDGQGVEVPSDWERWNTDIALGWTPDQDTWVEFTAGQADGEAVYAGRGMDGSKFARESVGVRVEKKNITETLKKVTAQVNYNFNDHVMDNFSLREFNPAGGMMHPMATNVARKTLNARIALDHKWENLELTSGIDTQNNQHSTRKGHMNAYQDLARIDDMKFSSIGGFAEFTYHLDSENRMVSGLRLDQVEVIDERITAFSQKQSRDDLLTSAFLRFENLHPDHDDGKTYIGLGYVERMPDYWELFSPLKGNGHENTFKNVNIEKTLQLDAGYQHQHGGLSSWASVYAGIIDDYILTQYVESKDEKTGAIKLNAESRNIDAVIAGAEAGIGYYFTDSIQADVSAMYAWGKNTTNKTPLAQISPLEARVNLRYVKDRYNVGVLWRVVDGQDRVSINEGNIVGYDLEPSSGFTTLSLNGSYQLNDQINMSLGIDNIFNKTYAEHLNKNGNAGFGDGLASDQKFNNIGRNYWARISMKF